MIYITAIHINGGNGHEHIASLRWRNPNTLATGQSTRTQMVTWIRDQQGDARVQDGVGDVRVGVVEASPPYVRTYADGKWTNNLLALPRY